MVNFFENAIIIYKCNTILPTTPKPKLPPLPSSNPNRLAIPILRLAFGILMNVSILDTTLYLWRLLMFAIIGRMFTTVTVVINSVLSTVLIVSTKVNEYTEEATDMSLSEALDQATQQELSWLNHDEKIQKRQAEIKAARRAAKQGTV